jgi:hypothetical protein
MLKNKPFTDREKEYIILNKDRMTRGDIAKHLQKEFGEDNDGELRNPLSIANLISDYNAQFLRVQIGLLKTHKERFAKEKMEPAHVDKLVNDLLADHWKRVDEARARARDDPAKSQQQQAGTTKGRQKV